jgi:hypothetical protein
MERIERYKLITLIENRIKNEYRKHKDIEWPLIAATKITNTIIDEYLEPKKQTK